MWRFHLMIFCTELRQAKYAFTIVLVLNDPTRIFHLVIWVEELFSQVVNLLIAIVQACIYNKTLSLFAFHSYM